MPTPPIPGWNEPVATGTRSPIFSVAFCPSTERICGFWISLVLLSENRALTLAELIVTWKSVALRFASEFKLIEPLLLFVVVPLVTPFVVVVPLVVVVVVVFTFGCNCTVMLVGGFTPSVRFLSLLIWSTAR